MIVGEFSNTNLINNLAFNDMTDQGSAKFGTIANNANDKNGLNITISQINADGTFGGRFTGAGGWTTQNGSLPGLFGYPISMPQYLRE